MKDKIVGPIFIDGTLNSHKYLNILQALPQALADAQFEVANLNQIILQQDGAPPHCTREVVAHLNSTFSIWIGRQGKIKWPARSPDLAPCDYFLWGYLKNKIYSHGPLETIALLKNRILEECKNIPSQFIVNAVNNFENRLAHCLEIRGGIFENLL